MGFASGLIVGWLLSGLRFIAPSCSNCRELMIATIPDFISMTFIIILIGIQVSMYLFYTSKISVKSFIAQNTLFVVGLIFCISVQGAVKTMVN